MVRMRQFCIKGCDATGYVVMVRTPLGPYVEFKCRWNDIKNSNPFYNCIQTQVISQLVNIICPGSLFTCFMQNFECYQTKNPDICYCCSSWSNLSMAVSTIFVSSVEHTVCCFCLTKYKTFIKMFFLSLIWCPIDEVSLFFYCLPVAVLAQICTITLWRFRTKCVKLPGHFVPSSSKPTSQDRQLTPGSFIHG